MPPVAIELLDVPHFQQTFSAKLYMAGSADLCQALVQAAKKKKVKQGGKWVTMQSEADFDSSKTIECTKYCTVKHSLFEKSGHCFISTICRVLNCCFLHKSNLIFLLFCCPFFPNILGIVIHYLIEGIVVCVSPCYSDPLSTPESRAVKKL